MTDEAGWLSFSGFLGGYTLAAGDERARFELGRPLQDQLVLSR